MSRIELLEAIQTAVKNVIGSIPGSDRPLMEAGLDSLGAVELRNSLAASFTLPELPATLTYDYPTMSALADFMTGTEGLA